MEDLFGRDPEHLLDLGRIAHGIGCGQVDLVECGHDLEVVLECEIAVGQCLRLDPLGCVDEQDHALTCCQRPRHLVAEVDVARRVDQVQDVATVAETNALELDRDAALALEVHRVEVLGPHVAGLDRPALLEHPVGQRALSVIDVGDHADVSDAIQFHVRR